MEETRAILARLLKTSPLLQGLSPMIVRALISDCQRMHLARGELLIRQGDPGDSMFFLVTGRLRCLFQGETGLEVPLGEIATGESVGEMTLLTGETRSASVQAIRDSEILKLTRRHFEELIQVYPEIALRLAQTALKRVQTQQEFPGYRPPRTIAILPLQTNLPIQEFARTLAEACSRWLPTTLLTSARIRQIFGESPLTGKIYSYDHQKLLHWLDQEELQDQLMLYVADPEYSLWTQRCVRQADVVLLLGDAEGSPELTELERQLASLFAHTAAPRVELALLHVDRTRKIEGTIRWLAEREIQRHYHLAISHPPDYERVARLLMGKAITLVLGGGGARGYAHLGVVQCLLEAGLPVDVVGGCSMGAIVGSHLAMGWDWPHILEVSQDFSQRAKRLLDYTFPVISLFAGRRTERFLRRHFEEQQIEDLWTTFFCITTNLNDASLNVHHRGSLVNSILASSALPGIFPPRIIQQSLHCDGGVLNNFPADMMKSLYPGPLLAVDVGVIQDLKIPASLTRLPTGMQMIWQKLIPFVQRPEKLPSLVSIIFRAATLSSIRLTQTVKAQADLYIRPPVEQFRLFDFHRLEDIMEAGYQTMSARLDEWREILERMLAGETSEGDQ